VTEALARLSPAAKVIAMALAKTPEQRDRIREQAVEVRSTELGFAEAEGRADQSHSMWLAKFAFSGHTSNMSNYACPVSQSRVAELRHRV
jgi:hypothetical protein